MAQRLRIEIAARDEFWRKAFFIEWEHQFPARRIISESNDYFLVEADWLNDLKRVAEECFSQLTLAPSNPKRRLLFRRFAAFHQKR